MPVSESQPQPQPQPQPVEFKRSDDSPCVEPRPNDGTYIYCPKCNCATEVTASMAPGGPGHAFASCSRCKWSGCQCEQVKKQPSIHSECCDWAKVNDDIRYIVDKFQNGSRELEGTDHGWALGFYSQDEPYYVLIDFCPFCGEELSEVARCVSGPLDTTYAAVDQVLDAVSGDGVAKYSPAYELYPFAGLAGGNRFSVNLLIEPGHVKAMRPSELQRIIGVEASR